MKENQLISVIVPVYNTESYLAEALDSVINQTYTNLFLRLNIWQDGVGIYRKRGVKGKMFETVKKPDKDS